MLLALSCLWHFSGSIFSSEIFYGLKQVIVWASVALGLGPVDVVLLHGQARGGGKPLALTE